MVILRMRITITITKIVKLCIIIFVEIYKPCIDRYKKKHTRTTIGTKSLAAPAVCLYYYD